MSIPMDCGREGGALPDGPGHQPSASAADASSQSGVPNASGRAIQCASCSGHGQVSSWSFGVKEPDECSDCGGSGQNWQYRGGAIARYYSGPFLGKEPAPAQGMSAGTAETQSGSGPQDRQSGAGTACAHPSAPSK